MQKEQTIPTGVCQQADMQISFVSFFSNLQMFQSHRSVCLFGVYVTLGQCPHHIHDCSRLSLTETLKVPPLIIGHFAKELFKRVATLCALL